MSRRLLAGLAGALASGSLLGLLFAPGAAFGARGLVTGFGDPGYQSMNPSERTALLDRTTQLDAGMVRLNLAWRTAAPSQPADPGNPGAYNLTQLDAAVREAKGRGHAVVLTVTGAPSWAEGPGRPPTARPGTWMPDPGAFGNFGRALAARYSGGFDPDGGGPAPVLPAIDALQAWNEPNLDVYLTPQWTGGAAASPAHYAKMLSAFYAGVKSANPSMKVVTGGTAPYGDDPGGNRVRPVRFLRELLCVNELKPSRPANPKKGKKGRPAVFGAASCPTPASFDVLAHHPINTTGGPRTKAVLRDDASSADLDRMVSVLRAAERLGTVPGGRHPVWATELWWLSNPPDGAGAPLKRHARYTEEALYLLWKAGVEAVLFLQLRDGPIAGLGNFGSGVELASGANKPAAQAFAFPFVTERLRRGKIRAWGKAPASGKLVIQRRARGWRTVKRLKVRKGEVFVTKLGLAGKQRLRAVVAGRRSLVWAQR